MTTPTKRTPSNANVVAGLDAYPVWAAPAWEGYAERLYPTPIAALDDVISNGLAKDAPDRGNLPVAFTQMVNHMTKHVEFWEKVMVFVRWRRAHNLGNRS